MPVILLTPCIHTTFSFKQQFVLNLLLRLTELLDLLRSKGLPLRNRFIKLVPLPNGTYIPNLLSLALIVAKISAFVQTVECKYVLKALIRIARLISSLYAP